METRVLIPDELSMVLTLHPNPRNVLEMNVALWSNTTLPCGSRFYPDAGHIRLDRLEVYSTLPEHDVRMSFGCEDTITEVDGRQVRDCNWVRFLKTSNVIADVNMVGMKIKGDVIFQTTKTILPNEEIVAYLRTDIAPGVFPASDSQPVRALTPDLTKVKMEAPDAIHTPRQLQVARDMLTSPPSRDDDCKSSVSDGTGSDVMSPKSTSTPETERYSDVDHPTSFTSDYPQQMSPLNLSSPRTPSAKSTSSSSIFTSPSASSQRAGSSPLTSPRSQTSMNAYTYDQTSSPEVAQRPKRNRERTWLPCDVCGKKFDRPSLLKRHIRTHTGEKPHACDVCGKAFSTSSSLNTHRRIHSGEKPHQCGVCGKRFTASSNLYYHRMTHNKEKPHKCQLCSKSFPTPGDLKSHMYVHNGSWPYRCDVCNRGFSKQTNLKNHLLLHTGDKPHECNVCQKKFALYCNLKTHIKTHEEDNQGRCTNCGRTFLKKDSSDICIDCTRASSPSSPCNNKRPVSDFSISKLTNNDDNGNVVTPAKPMDMTSMYDPRFLALYNPAMFLTPPSSHMLPRDAASFRFLTNYGELTSATAHAPGLLVPGSPAVTIADLGYHSRAAMAALSASWSGLMAK